MTTVPVPSAARPLADGYVPPTWAPTPPAVIRPLPPIATTPELDALIAAGAPVAFGVSGGKDGSALVLEGNAELDRRGHIGPRLCINADLGALEWGYARPHCEALASRVGLPLLIVRREKGDLLDRWKERWTSNVERYARLEVVQLILPWSSPGVGLFCRSELKIAVICRGLVQQFPNAVILSATGVRRDESANRSATPILKAQDRLTNKTNKTSGFTWNPLIDWTLDDVLACHQRYDFPLNVPYIRHNMSRFSCRFCVVAGQHDLSAAAHVPENAGLFLELVDIEIASTYSFQSDRWLADVAPHLLNERRRAALREAKERRAARVSAGGAGVSASLSAAHLAQGVREGALLRAVSGGSAARAGTAVQAAVAAGGSGAAGGEAGEGEGTEGRVRAALPEMWGGAAAGARDATSAGAAATRAAGVSESGASAARGRSRAGAWARRAENTSHKRLAKRKRAAEEWYNGRERGKNRQTVGL